MAFRDLRETGLRTQNIGENENKSVRNCGRLLYPGSKATLAKLMWLRILFYLVHGLQTKDDWHPF